MRRILFLIALVAVLGISAQSCREMGIDPLDKGKGNGGGGNGEEQAKKHDAG